MAASGQSAVVHVAQPSDSHYRTKNEQVLTEAVSEHGARVLVIDDEQGIRRFLRTSLTAQGYDIYEASTGQEGLQAVPISRPDLIILDLGLPDIDGVDVTRALREWTQTPILILSVREQEGDKVAALDAGADDYLTKPFGVAELLARMRAASRRANNTASGRRRFRQAICEWISYAGLCA